MKLGFASDLHLEFGGCDLVGEADVLILAGDIFVVDDIKMFPFSTSVPQPQSTKFGNSLGYCQFLEDISARFERTYIILGNHEYYQGKFNKTYEVLKHNVESKFSNIWVLENECIELTSTTKLLAATMWTNMNNMDYHIMEINNYWMNDYRKVLYKEGSNYRKLKPKDTINQHIETIRFFERELKEDGNFIIVTHHAPSMLSTVPKRDSGYEDEILYAYGSNLEAFIAEHVRITHWIHGHVHHKLNYFVEGCNILCNPRGYYGHEHNDIEHRIQVIEI